MTGRQVGKASPGLEGAMRPLASIGRGKLSEGMRTRILEVALDRGLKEVLAALSEIVAEERRLNESLSKYKRADLGKSDFDKTLSQLTLVATLMTNLV